MSMNETSSLNDISAATQALIQAAETLNKSANQMIHLMQNHSVRVQPDAVSAAVATQVNIFEDDPFSETSPTVNPPTAGTTVINTPTNSNPLLQIRFTTPEPVAARYTPGSSNFRHWSAKEAVTRAINFWAPLLPVGTRWSTSNPMAVTLVAGQTLNANYTRAFGLRFYQQTVRGVPIFSAESPDVACHELGHAILDALRPQLFNVPFTEVGAFHESFSDMSAILSALQVPTLRQKVLAETQGRLNINSRLSRLAEQLGWGIRQFSPTAVDRDCLRNAANRFFYRPPDQLPPSAPSDQLSSDVHFFSRVFTGAFLDVLARMVSIAGGANDANLIGVSRDLGLLLADGIRTAPILPAYYSQVAASMIQADRVRNNGRYRTALNSAFIERGILSVGAVNSLDNAPVPQLKHVSIQASQAGELYGMSNSNGFGFGPDGLESMLLDYNDGTDDGYRHGPQDAPDLPLGRIKNNLNLMLLAHVVTEPERFSVAPGAFASGQSEVPGPERAAENFIEDLIQLRRLDARSIKEAAPEIYAISREAADETTHTLVDTSDGLVLKRLKFNCGLC